jgi:putative transposase
MEIYHVLNRGVDKRKVFLEETDYVRFIHDLYIFNDAAPANPNHRFQKESSHSRKPLVDILAFCLMPNHYHLLLSERRDGGISLFMRKLNMGYSKYFNEKYSRSGVLWQGTFKKIRIARDAQFLYIPYYIHLNALDLSFPEWRKGGVKNVKKALGYLDTYRWSSFLDYRGKKNFPSLLTHPLFSSLPSYEQQKKTIADIITDATNAAFSESLE